MVFVKFDTLKCFQVIPEHIDSQVAQQIKDLVTNGITDPAVLNLSCMPM